MFTWCFKEGVAVSVYLFKSHLKVYLDVLVPLTIPGGVQKLCVVSTSQLLPGQGKGGGEDKMGMELS